MTSLRNLRRSRAVYLLPLLMIAGLVGCTGDGNFKIFGYDSKPPFDPNIRSVYIPIFKNVSFIAGPHRGVEYELTQEVIEELNLRRTPIRVVSDPSRADTELIGTVILVNKLVHNRNTLNLNREFDVVLTAEVVWRDLRTGRVLSGSRNPSQPDQPERPFDPSLPPPPAPPPDQVAIPVAITAYGRVLPELGESSSTGQQKAIKELARRIVDMMEQPW